MVGSASDQPRLLGTNPLVFFCSVSSPRLPHLLCIEKYFHRDIFTATRAPSSSEPRINGPGGGIDCDFDRGLRRLSISALLARLSSGALAHSALFFPGLASWLFLARLDTVHRRLDEERTSGTGVGGRENCLVASISTESRAPSTPPTRPPRSCFQLGKPPTRRRTGINSCGSRHIPIPRTGLGVARIAAPCL